MWNSTGCASINVERFQQSEFWDQVDSIGQRVGLLLIKLSAQDALHWDQHRIGWAVAGGCASLTVVITLCNVMSHVLCVSCLEWIDKETHTILANIVHPLSNGKCTLFHFKVINSLIYAKEFAFSTCLQYVLVFFGDPLLISFRSSASFPSFRTVSSGNTHIIL